MKRFIRQFILAGLVGVCCFASRSFADIPYLQGFETDTNDWTAYLWMDRVASGSGPLGVSSFQGSYHAVISNKQDAYSAGLGQAGYTYFGNPDATYNGDFFAGISLYVNTNWATGGGFWVDQSPRGTNDATAWDDEQHFKLDVQNPGTVRVTFSGGALPVYLNESGWYTFLETFRRTGPDETDLVQNDFLVFDEAGGLVAARTITSSLASTMLGGNSYLWMTVWANGFADDIVAMDNARTGYIKTWNGTGDWYANPENWSNGVPGVGDIAVIASGSVMLTNSTPNLGTLLVTGGSLVLSNWTTSVTASNVALTGGEITLPNAFTETEMSNRVWIVCTNLVVEAGGLIDASGKGFAGAAPGSGTAGYGPGAGDGAGGRYCGGGGYGGRGGWGIHGTSLQWYLSGGTTYGSISQPLAPGSGGGTRTDAQAYGGDGGGAVWIDALGKVTVDGTISANGSAGNYYSGGGSGGGIYISCDRLDGNGSIAASGGDRGNYGGPGGGGRIALDYNNLIGTPALRLETEPADPQLAFWDTLLRWTEERWMGEPGTIHLPDTNLLTEVVSNLNGKVSFDGLTSWAPDSLTVTNTRLQFAPGFSLEVAGSVTVPDGAALELEPNGYFSCGGDLLVDGGRLVMNVFTQMDCRADIVVTNGGKLYAYSAPTNGTSAYGALVDVAGDIHVAGSSWILPDASPTNGGPVRFRAANVNVAPGGGFDAGGRGFGGPVGAVTGDGYGPGAGIRNTYGTGAGYGGKGGDAYYNGWKSGGGASYGNTNAPVMAGSGGGAHSAGVAGHGGGVVWIEAASSVVLDGTLNADGATTDITASGGGSGGGIFVSTPSFSGGSGGLMTADGGGGDLYAGGPNAGGDAGGGRIAVAIGFSDAARDALIGGTEPPGLYAYTEHTGFDGSFSVAIGTTGPDYSGEEARAPQPGTYRFITTNLVLNIVGNPDEYDSPAPQGYGGHSGLPGGATMTNTVVSPANEVAGQRWVCLGWTLTDESGGAVDSGSSTQAVFDLDATRTLTWNWTNEYQLTMSSSDPLTGAVRLDANGWHTNTTVVTGLWAVASNGYIFSEWTGDVPSGKETDNPLEVTMDQARSIVGQFASASGVDRYWSGTGTWQTVDNWTPAGMPGPYDHAIVTSGQATVILPRSANEITISNNATVVFTNWTTSLTASNVTIASGGKVTLPEAFTDSEMSNRVWIICTNFTLGAGGMIDAVGKGFSGGPLASASDGYGPGKGLGGNTVWCGGAGHGGRGAWGRDWNRSGGTNYGNAAAPIHPGSGGGTRSYSTAYGGDGGGAVRIDASGDVVLDGTMDASGTGANYYSGGGSGGGIYITCQRLGGDGLIRANGGDRANDGGAGGGGRISLDYTGLIGSPAVRIETVHAENLVSRWDPALCWSDTRWMAEPGTIYLSDTNLLSTTVTNLSGCLTVPGFTAWSPASLVVSNVLLQFEPGFSLDVAGSLHVLDGASLELQAGSYLGCGGNMRLDGARMILNGMTQAVCGAQVAVTNGGALYVYSAPTNALFAGPAAVDVSGDVLVGPASWVFPNAERTNGAVVRFVCEDLVVADGGGFDADERGFASPIGAVRTTGYGPGGGEKVTYGAGGGYGGRGGDAYYNGWNALAGTSYGSSNAPVAPGSAGGAYHTGIGGHAGGAIWIEATRSVRLDGTLTANGDRGTSASGGGSGGGIFVRAPVFSGGANGSMTANGGNGAVFGSNGSGPGGGGRISVAVALSDGERDRIVNGLSTRATWLPEITTYSGIATAGIGTVGADYTGEESRAPAEGTVVFLKGGARGTLLMLR